MLDNQFRFRRDHSTIQKCHGILNSINKAIDEKNTAISVQLRLVNHDDDDDDFLEMKSTMTGTFADYTVITATNVNIQISSNTLLDHLHLFEYWIIK